MAVLSCLLVAMVSAGALFGGFHFALVSFRPSARGVGAVLFLAGLAGLPLSLIAAFAFAVGAVM